MSSKKRAATLHVVDISHICSSEQRANSRSTGLWYMITVLIILFKIGSLDGIDGIVTVLALQKLVNTSPDDIVVVQAKGALWMLQKDNEEQQLSQQKRMTGCSKLFCIPSCDW